ncbi:LOW QUALITY PROTEIN: hypothetical protein PanWU01x14_082960 [Parasponia andersonii]|uniref:Uncharacterized protein n=1 Tax=Parasponia andersonii TaxID=3476 RepID=A0A2P5DA01_PARAD|nr:LOW QUALITY PROTEIN: hypothetical protein PanWU01x14_082960 [Parasponia andersonii]
MRSEKKTPTLAFPKGSIIIRRWLQFELNSNPFEYPLKTKPMSQPHQRIIQKHPKNKSFFPNSALPKDFFQSQKEERIQRNPNTQLRKLNGGIKR